MVGSDAVSHITAAQRFVLFVSSIGAATFGFLVGWLIAGLLGWAV